MAKETETLNGQIFDVLEPEDRPRDTYGGGRWQVLAVHYV